MNRHILLGAAIATLLPASFRMTEDAPAAVDTPEPTQPGPGDTFAADAGQDETHTGVVVPNDHVDLFQRLVTLVQTGEQWVLDNIHAGVSTLENIIKDRDADKPAD